MIAITYYLLSCLAGALLGLVFFGGLWLTVRHLPRSRRPALLMLTSLLLRFTLVLAAFYAMTVLAGWPHTLAAAAGFTLPRLLLGYRLSGGRVNREADA